MFDRNFIVLELANILAGPMTSLFFAELGARVIKLENPHTSGDATRGWKLATESGDSDISSYFSCANWGKESLACDFTTEAGRELVYDLVKRADIVIASFKPGDETRLGLDWDRLSAINPRLIYGQITAYGADDPRPGFDAILQAEAGFTYLNGEADGPPTKMPVALIDLLLAHQLKQGLLLAIIKRGQTGTGSLVSASLLDAGVSSLANQATNYLVGNTVPQRMGSEHPNIVPYGSILACKDGREVVIAAATERQYRQLVSALGLAELADDARYKHGQLRVQNREQLLDTIRKRAKCMSSQELSERLLKAKVPFGFVNDMAAVFDQTAAQRLLFAATKDGETYRGVRSLALGGTVFEAKELAPPPHLNEHEPLILEQLLGYDAAKISQLRSIGAVGVEKK